MGGGNPCQSAYRYAYQGLSPRGRGKQVSVTCVSLMGRSIPAWAGETGWGEEIPYPAAVYPRVGGGNLRSFPVDADYGGLSPRGRGKRGRSTSIFAISRSIPAWAGETGDGVRRGYAAEVYPRVGGGNKPPLIMDAEGRGLSPRGRGKRLSDCLRAADRRSIPAWAGETRRRRIQPALRRVYPRVGGGNVFLIVCVLLTGGLSPRGRGKPVAAGYSPPSGGSIPAWAGETQTVGKARLRRGVYPRVGGGNSRHPGFLETKKGLSPRGRGKLCCGPRDASVRRSIPAWAGETHRSAADCPPGQVYPRVGGGNEKPERQHRRHHGLSPRGRGKPVQVGGEQPLRGSIPAWAGETRSGTMLMPPWAVYPRVGGGNGRPPAPPETPVGLSPRGRGKPAR